MNSGKVLAAALSLLRVQHHLLLLIRMRELTPPGGEDHQEATGQEHPSPAEPISSRGQPKRDGRVTQHRQGQEQSDLAVVQSLCGEVQDENDREEAVGKEARTSRRKQEPAIGCQGVGCLGRWVLCHFRHAALRLLESAIRFTSTHHLLTISVEGVVYDPLGGIDLVIVLIAQVTEAFGDGVQPCRFGLVPERVVRVRPVDDLRQQDEGRITGEVVLLHDGVEGAFLAVMTEFYVRHVIGDGSLPLSGLHHLVGRDEQKLGLRVHELLDEPRTSHSVHLDSFSCYVFHR